MPARALSRTRPFTDELHALASARDPACLLDLEGTILFVNEAWDRFAAENGGADACRGNALVGTRLVDRIAGDDAREMFRYLFQRALRQAGGGAAVMTSECNGPEAARLLVTHAEAVLSPAGAPIGVSFVHRLVRELPVTEVYEPVDGSSRSWRDEDGALVQCGCCRRTRRPEAPEEWEFVTGLVAAPPRDTVFVYCDLCRELHHAAGPSQIG